MDKMYPRPRQATFAPKWPPAAKVIRSILRRNDEQALGMAVGMARRSMMTQLTLLGMYIARDRSQRSCASSIERARSQGRLLVP